MKSRMVGTRVTSHVRVEFIKLADELGLDTAGLLRAMIHAILINAGRIQRPERPGQHEEDDDRNDYE